jgi:hypothetical protein
VSGGPFFQYNKNPHDVIYAIKRLDRETGEIQTIVATPGGAVRPQPSPDGKSLAFVKRVREKSVLHRIDLDGRGEAAVGRPLARHAGGLGDCSVRMRTTTGCRFERLVIWARASCGRSMRHRIAAADSVQRERRADRGRARCVSNGSWMPARSRRR